MSSAGQYEVVMLFDAEEQIDSEMHFSEFESLTNGGSTLQAKAATQTLAAYCVVGNGLSLRGVVFFMFRVDEAGVVDASFNVPLRYLVKHAGAGPDLGHGSIRQASRGQCPVPWHALNLWQPSDTNCVELVQRRIYRNKLKLKSVQPHAADPYQAPGDAISDELLQELGQEKALEVDRASLNARLTDVLGEQGRVSMQDLIRAHAEQLKQAKDQYRADIEAQQTAYLDQLRNARDEIHELKVALRQEQGRNRRLQQMLRGEL